MQTGEPEQPVQHSLITASSGGFFLRWFDSPSDQGQLFVKFRSTGIFGSAGGFALGFGLAGGGAGGAAAPGFGVAGG